MKITDLPIEDRPREKALLYGVDSLSNEELLAIILGHGTKDINAIQLASSVLSYTGGIKGLLTSSYQSLLKIKGINKAQCLKLQCISILFRTTKSPSNNNQDAKSIQSILERYQELVSFETQEETFIIILNRLGRIIVDEPLSKGTSSSVPISIRDIFKEIYIHNGYSFYLIHTHPNSIALPSEEDIKSTLQIKKKAAKAGLKLLDHYIVSKNGYVSINQFLDKNN